MQLGDACTLRRALHPVRKFTISRHGKRDIMATLVQASRAEPLRARFTAFETSRQATGSFKTSIRVGPNRISPTSSIACGNGGRSAGRERGGARVTKPAVGARSSEDVPDCTPTVRDPATSTCATRRRRVPTNDNARERRTGRPQGSGPRHGPRSLHPRCDGANVSGAAIGSDISSAATQLWRSSSAKGLRSPSSWPG